ncbi:MAG: response regulator [Candidatus Electrothrix sp. AR3]|nr:response regulator [Candidatus Electrothrix sp. AR3]
MDTKFARILIVDDDPTIIGILRHILEKENYAVLEAQNGRDGLKFAQLEQPDLILLDINLPDIFGFEVCRELKAKAETQEIPVIFLTAAEEEENEYRGFNEGAADFLHKPIIKVQLCVRVKNALEIKYGREKLKQQTRDLEKINARLKESLIMQEQIRRNLLQRDQVLCAVNYVAKTFLQTYHWRDIIKDVLCYLGQTVNCEQVYLRIFDDENSGPQTYTWYSVNHTVERSSVELLTAWRQPAVLLAAGKPIIVPNKHLPDSLWKEFEKNKLRTCLLLPVFIRQTTLWGCLGFDCRHAEKSWEELLVRAMVTTADIIGSAIQRTLESRERMRLAAAINQFVDCVLMTDKDGNIFYANPATKIVTGYLPEELLGSNFSEIQFDELDKINCEKILDLAAGDDEWCGNMRNHHKDGTLYDESLMIIPVKDDHQQVNSFCIIKRDQTEKKRLESIVEAANLMENVGFVFSGIRHELGNPLNSLKMALSVLRRQLGTLSPQKIEEFLERSMGEINRMEYLLYSLKNFNLLEKQHLAPVDLVAFLENFKRLHQQDLQQKGIRLDLVTGRAVFGLVDERALHQVQ